MSDDDLVWEREFTTFPAKYSGTLECGCEVEEGDPIGYNDDDDLMCEGCLNR